MKIKNILAETLDTNLGKSIDFNTLTSLNIAALRAIDDERMDVKNASERMMDVLYELQYNELIDNSFKLTPNGKKAIALAQTLGGSKERRRAGDQKDVDIDAETADIYKDDHAGNDELGDDESIYQGNKFGSPNQMY